MLRRRDLLASAAAAGALSPFASAFAQAAPGGGAKPVVVRTGEAAKFHKMMDDWMERGLKRSPEGVTYLGLDKDPKWAASKSKLSDASMEQVERDRVDAEVRLKEIKALNRSALTGLDAVHYDTLPCEQEASVANNRRFPLAAGGPIYVYGLSQLSGSYQQTPDFLDSAHQIETAADAEAYLSRLNEFGRVLDQEAILVRHDVAMGVIPPDFALDKAKIQMQGLRDQTPDKSVLVQSVVRRTKDKIPGDWNARASKIYVERIQPALDRQLALIAEMRARTTHDAGIWKIKDGEAFYAASLRQSTTTDMSPEEIHKTGIDMVASLQAQTEALMRKQGLTSGTVGERFRAMYTDPQFHYPNTPEGKKKLLDALNGQIKVITGKLPQYFGQLPKAPLEIRAVPEYLEAGAPGGYYNTGSLDGSRPGVYYINLRDTAEVPSWTLPTLTYHEGLPGHHLQLTLQFESEVPLLMKTVGFSAYSEGWGLYSEELAVEMGMYENDPWGQIGMLHDAIFRGVRLVVDSGMHAKRWSREQAVKYYVDNIGDQEAGAITEIERYSVWPGQACSYMVGKIQILRLRAKAKAALGDRFDIRKFHDTVLLNGAVPLALLERIVDEHIRTHQA